MLADVNLRHRDVIKNWLTYGAEWEVPSGKPKVKANISGELTRMDDVVVR